MTISGTKQKNMKKLIKLSGTHYIIVDDSTIKEGNLFKLLFVSLPSV